jgi:hypothetical protein
MCMSPGRRPLGWKNTEGVGESRGYESSSEVCAVARCGDNPAPLLHQPRKRRLMKLEPLSRRRPQASTGPAMSNAMHSPLFDSRRPV